MNNPLRNIGIFAHVDAGKTTLTEQLLCHCSVIREAGSVDAGTAHTDRMDIERRRGISIRSTCAPMEHKGVRINLIDTPGHADFAAEVERSLWALDGAVLLLSAMQGVQPQAAALFRAFTRAKLPTLVFINKTDWAGTDLPALLAQARQALSDRIVCAQDDEQVMALLAEDDDATLEAYLGGTIYPREALQAALRQKTLAGEAYPLWHGSALQDIGIDALLDAMVSFLPPPGGDAAAAPSGVVFALDQDKTLGRAALVRLFSGAIANRDEVLIHPRRQTHALGAPKARAAKITQIRDLSLEGRGADLGALHAGKIGAIFGLGEVRVGDTLGEDALLPRGIGTGGLGTPLLMVKAQAPDTQRTALRAALGLLAAEDPLLGVEDLGGAPHVRVMGAIQLEVLTELLSARFGLEVAFGTPNVIYRETIARPAVGFFAYTMPKPCWAVVKFQLDPLPRGSGIEYASVVPAREIMPRYQHQVEQALPLALRQGMLGWQVEDVRITLIGGEHHLVHTHPLDFILATPVALMDGLRRGGSILLEPILSMRMAVPAEAFGRIISEVALMRGTVDASQLDGEQMHITATVPLATSVDFSVRLASITAGRGALSVRLAGYRDCETDPPPTCPRHSVHPLDTAKYILAARNAIGAGVFESL